MVGFNALCDGLSADASMALLDALWQRFDTLATAHGCYKVEARVVEEQRMRLHSAWHAHVV